MTKNTDKKIDIIYGIKTFNSNSLLDVEIINYKYTWKDLFWMIPMYSLLLAFIAFTIFFYWHFPHQMIWLIPSLLVIFMIK